MGHILKTDAKTREELQPIILDLINYVADNIQNLIKKEEIDINVISYLAGGLGRSNLLQQVNIRDFIYESLLELSENDKL